MANSKITELPNLTVSQAAINDLTVVVDVNDTSSPSGNTKNMTLGDLSTFILGSSTLFSSSAQVTFTSASGITQVQNGGTSTSSFPVGAILVGNGTGAIQSVVGTSGQVLQWSGSNVAFVGGIITSSQQINFNLISNVPALISSSLQLPEYVVYADDWDANTNNPTLPPADVVPGYYYYVSSSGIYGGTTYMLGDKIISDGIRWSKITGQTVVSSSFASTASYWSGSIVNSATASYAQTASYVQNISMFGLNAMVITASSNFIMPATIVKVRMCGAGAGGTSNNGVVSPGGGSAGGYCEGYVTGYIGQIIPVVIGDGATANHPGGTTLFAGLSATGGNPSIIGAETAGTPGVGSGGYLNIYGGYGAIPGRVNGGAPAGGAGGASFFGGGGSGPGLAPGAGGAAENNDGYPAADGADGIVIVEW